MKPLRALFPVLALIGVAPLVTPAAAQQPAQAPAPPPITMKQIKPDVWAALGGAGGNVTIIVGKTSVIVVDAKQTEPGAKDLLAEVAKVTPKPVKTAIIDGEVVVEGAGGVPSFPALQDALATGGAMSITLSICSTTRAGICASCR